MIDPSGDAGRGGVPRGAAASVLCASPLRSTWQRVSLGVWFPPTKLNTLGTTPELVEHHPGRARVHRVVPKKPAHGIERAVYVVDTIINPDLVAILDLIFGHGLNLSGARMNERSAENHDHVAPAPLSQRVRYASPLLGLTLARQSLRIRAGAHAPRSGRHGAECEPSRSVLTILHPVWGPSKPAACG